MVSAIRRRNVSVLGSNAAGKIPGLPDTAEEKTYTATGVGNTADKDTQLKKAMHRWVHRFFYIFNSFSRAASFRLMVSTSIAFSSSSTGGRLGAIRR